MYFAKSNKVKGMPNIYFNGQKINIVTKKKIFRCQFGPNFKF